MADFDLRYAALGDLERELEHTRTMLERAPEERFGWRPHDRSWTLGELCTHLARVPSWGLGILQGDEMDLADLPPRTAGLGSREEVLALFDQNAGSLRSALSGASRDDLAGSWTLRYGDDVIAREPRTAVMRQWCLSHMIHHRAQLGVYLRLLDQPVPNMYGPTADEQ